MTTLWTNSPLVKSISKLRRMVALSASFQSRAEIEYAEALERVWTEYVPPIDELIRDTDNPLQTPPLMPYASIWPMQFGFNATSGGERLYTIAGGALHLYLAVEPLVTLHGWNDRREDAIAFLGQWLTDTMALSELGTPVSPDAFTDGEGYLTATSCTVPIIDHTPFKDRETEGDFYWLSAAITWGDTP